MSILPLLPDEGTGVALADGEPAGAGTLTTARGNLPLEAIDVQARITGLVARTELAQTFVNPFPGPLPYDDGEATYRFPLVVAPRYVPGSPLPVAPAGDGTALDTDEVPDASR